MSDSNMLYGAESLRQKEFGHTFMAQLIALLIIATVFSFPLLKSLFVEDETASQLPVKAKKVVNYSELSAPPPIDLKKPPPEMMKSPPKVKTVKFLQPVAKKDEEVLEEEMVPTIEEMSESQIGDFEQDGTDSVVVLPEEEVTMEVSKVESEVYSFVEKMPVFPGGGDQALMKYLSENIDYPEIAKRSGIQGVVYISFVIENDGSISNVKVLRGVAKVLDQEAVRVVESMPSWTPGEQNGRKVRVSYTVPLRFKLIE